MIHFEANVTTTNAPMYPQHSQQQQPLQYAHHSSYLDQQQQQQPHQQNQPQLQLQPQQQSQHTQQQQPQPQPPQLIQPQPDTDASLALTKFLEHDIQVLKQLLVTGEKNKWKQITKEINLQALMRRNGVTRVQDLPSHLEVSSPTDELFNGSRGDGHGNLKNVSPTFVIKQYQSLLGLPNNQLYFGSLGSSLPYVVAENGWSDIE